MNNQLIAALDAAKRAKPRRVQREHPFQKIVFEYLTLALPPEAVLTSIDHAGAVSAATRGSRRARGVLEGIPDIHFTWRPDPTVGLHISCWVETKAGKGVLKTSQELWRDHLLSQGHYWIAPRTLDEVIAWLPTTGIRLRPVRLQ